MRRGASGCGILLGIVAITLAVLTLNLITQVRLEQEVRAAVSSEVGQLPSASLVDLQIDQSQPDIIKLDVTIRSTQSISYEQTVTLQKGIAGRLNRTVELILTVVPTTRLNPFMPPTPTPPPTNRPTPTAAPTSTWTPTTTPTTTPAATPTATPTATSTNTPTPTATPVVVGVIANTGGQGVLVRASPGGRSFAAWTEGTRVTLISGPVEADGRAWLRLSDESGVEGWVAAEYVSLGQ